MLNPGRLLNHEVTNAVKQDKNVHLYNSSKPHPRSLHPSPLSERAYQPAVYMSQLIPSTTPDREFIDHTDTIHAVSVFPDTRRLVTASEDLTLRLWDLKTGVMLKKMDGHRSRVSRLAVSRDGQLIASGDYAGEVIAWRGETGEPLTQPIKASPDRIFSLDFSPDGTVLTTGSEHWDKTTKTTKLWSTKTWQLEGNPIECNKGVRCVRYSPSGKLLAIATYNDVEIYNSDTRERITNFKGHTRRNFSLVWTPDGTRLLTGGDEMDLTIREWDTRTWQQIGDPWTGHTSYICDIAINPAGTLVASASFDRHVRLWRLSDQRTVAIFQHSAWTTCVTFSTDGKHILSGGVDQMISEWVVPEDAWPEGGLNKSASKGQVSVSKILAINTPAHNACVLGDLSLAEDLFTQEIAADANNYTSYANRSLVMARKLDWDHALDDANKSLAIQASLTGYISKGIALCGKRQVRDARIAFDIAFMFTNEDSKIIHFLLLVKSIAMFNADEHEEAMMLVQQLATACPNNNTLACWAVEAYLCVRLGIDALNGARHDEAADYFTAAINSGAFSSKSDNHSIYEDLAVLFGWDLEPLWQIAHQTRCHALLRAGRLGEALESYRCMMDMSDDTTKANCLDWSTAFKQECSVLCLDNGDVALAASDYDRAIDLYSVVTNLNLASDTAFANRSKAKSGEMLWEDALLDAQKVIELNPSSHMGYEVKHAALHGAQRYDEAIEAIEMMISKLNSTTDMKIRKLREQYVSPSEAEGVIRQVIDVQLDTAPLRLLNTATGLLCDREVQISAFKMSIEYKKLLSSIMKHANLQMEHITEVVTTYFRCVMLSHRWEGKEPLLQDIQDKIVYEMNSLGGIVKLRTFCEIVRDAGYRWAWSDTRCIDKSNNVELQESLNSMFMWYHHSSLTIVYLPDVPPSSKSGALAKSEWNRRGWTFQEILASKVVLFYRKDWSLYLDDRSPNHKESAAIMEELEDATGIDARALVSFQPGMRGAREKLQWASRRITTLQEDVAYSLFGIFGVHLPVIYGEKKQNALGRLLQEIVARSGDISALDWVGQSSEFNSCLPADITSYAVPPRALPSLSENEIQTVASSLRDTVVAGLALKLYTLLDNMSAPRFTNCRLHLRCIAFRVTEIRRKRGPAQDTQSIYGVKADGLNNLLITTADTLIQFTPTRPVLQTFLLVRAWDRRLLELPDFAEQPAFADDVTEEWSEPESLSDQSSGVSPAQQELTDSESHSRALRLIVRLGQPFSAFLLAQQRGGEYKRIASDHDIIAQVKDLASVHNMMDIRTLEIL